MIYSYDKIEAEKFIMMDAHKYINADWQWVMHLTPVCSL